MHSVVYVCLPRPQARNSLQARKKVCDYLTEEGFDTLLRFSGRCDYFSVGGCWSRRLTLLRLRHEQPKVFDRFWKRLKTVETREETEALFRKAFPDFRGKLPLNREDVGFDGEADDAQLMDRPLFDQLQAGFSDELDYCLAQEVVKELTRDVKRWKSRWLGTLLLAVQLAREEHRWDRNRRLRRFAIGLFIGPSRLLSAALP